jgi:2,5-diamino-6-(ribosylamino)-4(3H)-pyrimidinone 5'-phosphate reductase
MNGALSLLHEDDFMKRPDVIQSNAMSLNGSLTGFPVDYAVYYPILLSYKPDMVLVGSQTVLAAKDEIPPEEDADRRKRSWSQEDSRPFLVVVDSRGRLEGMLHAFRRMVYIRDLIILISHSTPKRYLRYLEEREYDTVCAGERQVNLERAFEVLHERFGARTIVTDTGCTLNAVLLDAGLVDRISILVVPVLAAQVPVPLYAGTGTKDHIDLTLVKYEPAGSGYIHIEYAVRKAQ